MEFLTIGEQFFIVSLHCDLIFYNGNFLLFDLKKMKMIKIEMF